MKSNLTKDGRHRFKWFKYRGENIRIDIDLSKIIPLMWKLGIKTTNCCQSRCAFSCKHSVTSKKKDGITHLSKVKTKECDNSCWIVFESQEDIEKFYNSIAVNEFGFPNCSKWEIRTWADDEGFAGHWGRQKWGNKRSTKLHWIEDYHIRNNFKLSIQLTFPRKDIHFVERLLELSLSKNENI